MDTGLAGFKHISPFQHDAKPAWLHRAVSRFFSGDFNHGP
jgi:hypothetical protein